MSYYDSITLSHSTNQGSSVRFRDDVGIVPYNRDGPRPFNVQSGSVRFRDDVGIVPYKRDGPRPIQWSDLVQKTVTRVWPPGVQV